MLACCRVMTNTKTPVLYVATLCNQKELIEREKWAAVTFTLLHFCINHFRAD